jgi:hypothetical protein
LSLVLEFGARNFRKDEMKKLFPLKIPKFKSDEEIAVFMEKCSGFDLLDAGLAEIVPNRCLVLFLS